MKSIQRGISFLLALVLILGMIPAAAVRAEATEFDVETVADEIFIVDEETVPVTEETADPETEPVSAEEETAAATEAATQPTVAVTEPVTEPAEETEPAMVETTAPVELSGAPGGEVEASARYVENLVYSGTYGRFTWTLTLNGWINGYDQKDLNGVFYLDGYGYEDEFGLPEWYDFRHYITEAHISSGITNVPESAFYDCWALREVHMADTVTLIGASAFNGCEQLTSVELSSNLKTVEPWAFIDCESLRELVFPEGLTYIGDLWFWDKLDKLVLPSTLTYFGGIYRSSVENLYFRGTEEQWAAVEMSDSHRQSLQDIIQFEYTEITPNSGTHGDLEWNLDTRGTLTITGSGDMEETDAAAEFGWYEEREKIKKLVIGDGITGISRWAFVGCSNLEQVILPESLRWIDEDAFWQCGKLSKVTFKGSSEAWENWVTIRESGNEDLLNAHVYFESIKDCVDNQNITINNMGSAFAYYMAEPNQKIEYSLNDSETVHTVYASDKGIFGVPLGTYTHPGTYSSTVVIHEIDDQAVEYALEKTATVTITNLTYKQSWEVSLDSKLGVGLIAGAELDLDSFEAKATFGKVKGELGAGAVIHISKEYAQNSETLELNSSRKVSAGAKTESGVSGKVIGAQIIPTQLTGKLSANPSAMYGLKIKNYNPEDRVQQRAVATYFLGEALQANPALIMLKGFYDYLTEDAYNQDDFIEILGSTLGLNGSLAGDIGNVKVNGKQLFGINGWDKKVAASIKNKWDISGGTEKSVAYQTELSLYDLTLKQEENNGQNAVVPEFEKEFLSEEISIITKDFDEEKSLEVVTLRDPFETVSKYLFGKETKANYNKYKFTDDALDEVLSGDADFRSFVNGKNMVLSFANIVDLAELIPEVTSPVAYEREVKKRSLTSKDFKIGAGLGLAVDCGVTLSYLKETTYAEDMGYKLGEDTLLTCDSEDLSSLIAIKEEKLEDIFLAVLMSLNAEVEEFFDTLWGNITDGLSSAWCWITGKEDSDEDWEIEITAPEADQRDRAWNASYTVSTRKKAERFNGTGSNGQSTAATIGRPFAIKVTDNATGAAITDLSAEPLEFTIRYAREDLAAAGLNSNDAIVREGGIAMYRYSDDGEYFEYVGGVNDRDAMTVTATITKTGQYVLAVDSCAPALSYLEISDHRDTPTITAHIDDLTGMNASAFSFKIDGEEVVNGDNLSQHYNAQAGIFTYTVAESLSEGEHTLSFTLADTSGNVDTYLYSFQVDLTVPEITEVTVSGSANEGSVAEVRARICEPNLTDVYAVLSKLLPDGTWSREVTNVMGNLGNGLWGLDYEGDGSSVKIKVVAVDIAENTTESDVYEVNPFAESVVISQNYLLLNVGQTVQLSADVYPAELNSAVIWSLEEGSENIIAVDEGEVRALGAGTAYVLASVSDGEVTVTDRCRIDVTAPILLDGVQLGCDKLTMELYSSNDTCVDILLKLPQNYAAQSAGAGTQTPDLGVAIEAARFTEDSLNELFALGIQDDRTLSIIPTEKAMNEAKGNYTGTITVTVAGVEYESEAITLTVKNTLPKLKATVANFNSFYSGQSQQIQITGATVINITATSLPNWLTLDGNRLTLAGGNIAKSASGKAVLAVETEEWSVPVSVTLNVKNSYKAPGLKLSASNVSMTADAANSNGAQLKLVPGNKKDTLEALYVADITASNGYLVENFNISDGTFTLKATETANPGKITLMVSFSNTEETLSLPLTVKNAALSLKLSSSSVTLNPEIGDAAQVSVTATPADYRITNPIIRLEDSKKNDKLNSGELALNFANGVITVATTDTTPAGATYKLYISAGGSKEAALTVKTVEKAPAMTLKATGNIDLSFPENEVVVTPTFKNYSGAAISEWEYTVTEMKGKEILNANAKEFFEVEKEGMNFRIICIDPEALTSGNTYNLTLKLTLPNGSICESSVKLPVKQTAVKLKLSASSITLNKTVNDKATLDVTCATKGYTLGTPVWQLMDKTGKVSAEGKLDVSYSNGTLTVSVNDATQFGTTYKLLVKASEKAAATTLTVNIPAQNKSAITGTLKASGSIDVIRDGTSVTVTPSYKNCGNDANREERLEIYSSEDQYTGPVTDLFEITENADGTFTIIKSGIVNHSYKYQVKLVTDFGNGIIVESKPIAIKVAMGSAKLTVATGSTTLFANDKHSRVNFTIISTDNTLNAVKSVEIKDKKYQDILELYDYGNGEFAIGFKNGKVDSSLIGKTIALNLNVFLEGNENTKVNGTVKLKLSFVK